MAHIREKLLGGVPWTASTVAREIEVSAKTIHRDIEFMRDFLRYEINWDQATNSFTGTVPANAIL